MERTRGGCVAWESTKGCGLGEYQGVWPGRVKAVSIWIGCKRLQSTNTYMYPVNS